MHFSSFSCTEMKTNVQNISIEGLHDHVPAAMTGGRIKEYLSPKELNSFSFKMILLFLPPVMAAGHMIVQTLYCYSILN